MTMLDKIKPFSNGMEKEWGFQDQNQKRKLAEKKVAEAPEKKGDESSSK